MTKSELISQAGGALPAAGGERRRAGGQDDSRCDVQEPGRGPAHRDPRLRQLRAELSARRASGATRSPATRCRCRRSTFRTSRRARNCANAWMRSGRNTPSRLRSERIGASARVPHVRLPAPTARREGAAVRYLCWVANAVLFVLLVGFALKNSDPVTVRYFLGRTGGAAVAGAVAVLRGWARRWAWWRCCGLVNRQRRLIGELRQAPPAATPSRRKPPAQSRAARCPHRVNYPG